MPILDLLKRIPADHPQAATLRTAAEGVIAVAEQFASKKAALQKSGKFTDNGLREALREALPDAAARMASIKSPIAKLQREVRQRRAAIDVPTPDPSNVAGALERAEIRTFLRSMPAGERNALLAGTTDVRLLESALTAPPELSGLSGERMKGIADQVETRYLEMKYGDEVKAVAALEDAVAEAAAIAKVARGRLATEAGMDERQMTALVGPAEAAASAPWLVKSGDGKAPLVVEIDENDRANYRSATEWEQRSGVFYKDAAEYRAAQGEAA